jgi:hypothetical protein
MGHVLAERLAKRSDDRIDPLADEGLYLIRLLADNFYGKNPFHLVVKAVHSSP